MSIKNRYDIKFYVQCKYGNINGDPDAGNLPRQDTETGIGIATDVSIKNAVRNYITKAYAGVKGVEIFMQDGININKLIAKAHEEVGNTVKSKPSKADVERAQKNILEKYYDVRAFGAVMSTGANAGRVTGPVNFAYATTIDPIETVEITIARRNRADALPANVEKTYANYAEAESKKNPTELRTFGAKQYTPFGLYEINCFISAYDAMQTGFSEEDLAILLEALFNMYEHNRSSCKGFISVVSPIIVFKHIGRQDKSISKRPNECLAGCVPAHVLFDSVKVTLKPEVEVPRDYRDYSCVLNRSDFGDGVDVGFISEPSAEIEWNKQPKNSWLQYIP